MYKYLVLISRPMDNWKRIFLPVHIYKGYKQQSSKCAGFNLSCLYSSGHLEPSNQRPLEMQVSSSYVWQ